MVGEWLPQTATLSMSVTATPAFSASMETARLWSSRSIAVKASFGRSGADFMAI